MTMEKKRTHVPHKTVVEPIHEAMQVIVPNVCGTESGKQLLNIMSRFTGYHMATSMKHGVDKDAVLYNEAMRNVYRYFRTYIPKELLTEVEEGVYPYDLQQTTEEKETK